MSLALQMCQTLVGHKSIFALALKINDDWYPAEPVTKKMLNGELVLQRDDRFDMHISKGISAYDESTTLHYRTSCPDIVLKNSRGEIPRFQCFLNTISNARYIVDQLIKQYVEKINARYSTKLGAPSSFTVVLLSYPITNGV